MSAELLRRAAALMRERAEAATPGPYYTHDVYKVSAGNAAHPARVASTGDPADGEFVASWHPLVALAVADLLDGSANRWDDGDLGPDEWDELTAIARIYLAESS